MEALKIGILGTGVIAATLADTMNRIPASVYTKNENPSLSVPVMLEDLKLFSYRFSVRDDREPVSFVMKKKGI